MPREAGMNLDFMNAREQLARREGDHKRAGGV